MFLKVWLKSDWCRVVSRLRSGREYKGCQAVYKDSFCKWKNYLAINKQYFTLPPGSPSLIPAIVPHSIKNLITYSLSQIKNHFSYKNIFPKQWNMNAHFCLRTSPTFNEPSGSSTLSIIIYLATHEKYKIESRLFSPYLNHIILKRT